MFILGDRDYGEFVERVRVGAQTVQDIHTLDSRLYRNLPNKEYFDDAIWLISKTVEVEKFNQSRFEET